MFRVDHYVRTVQGRAVAASLGSVLIILAGCGQAELTGPEEVETESADDGAGETDEEVAEAGTDDDASTEEDAGDDASGDPEESNAGRAGSDAPTEWDECPPVDWRDKQGSFEGSLGPAREASDDPDEWIIDEHGPVGVAVPGAWRPFTENERHPEVWGYEAPVGDDAEGGLFVTAICGAPIIGVDGEPLDLGQPVESAGLDVFLGDPDEVREGPADYTAVWRDALDGLMSMRYDFVEVDEGIVVVLVTQALEPHVDELEGEQAENIDAVVESTGKVGNVDCPPAATSCVEERG